ncbi:AEC family transporter [Shewanella avicenniae]|uniref:AEC family transporter n=1 Tax=Shewanella avicenniae TaxID=2814294 RepID=A0ABX7QN84_9GAMM|nr:AEC family transporter [Shewanella avicenniae]QSX32355.1 AEC family transporter [Shewanella avicenniae]
MSKSKMGVGVIINQIFVLFVLMGLGYWLAKANILDKPTCDKLIWLLCYVVMPCLVFNAFQIPYSPEMWHNFMMVGGLAFGIHVLFIVMSKLLLNGRSLKQRGIAEQMQFTAVYSNCGFMGLPFVVALVGSNGAFYGSVYIAVNGIFVWTHGVMTHSGKLDRKSLIKVLLNPNTVVAIIGCLFFVFSISLPTALHDAVGHVGKMNTALALILVGAAMAPVKIGRIWFSSMAWLSVFVRNLLFPAVVLVCLLALEIKGDMLLVVLALSACPVAGMSVIFSQMTGKNTEFPISALTLSTIASLLTLPLMLSFAA